LPIFVIMFFLHCSSERLSRSTINFDLILDLKARAPTSIVFKYFNARYIDSKYYYSLSEFYASCQLFLKYVQSGTLVTFLMQQCCNQCTYREWSYSSCLAWVTI